MKAEVFLYLF